MKITDVYRAYEEGRLTTVDLGVWSFLSWYSDRAGYYCEPRSITATRVGLSVRQLRASVDRLSACGVLKILSKKGSRRLRWRVETKAKKEEKEPENVVRLAEVKQVREQTEKGSKPPALSHLPF